MQPVLRYLLVSRCCPVQPHIPGSESGVSKRLFLGNKMKHNADRLNAHYNASWKCGCSEAAAAPVVWIDPAPHWLVSPPAG